MENGLVFCSTIGTPLEPSNLIRHFHGILDSLKIDRRRVHELRNTSASLLLAQGATLHDAKEILGHSQIALTANLCGHRVYVGASGNRRSRWLPIGSLLAPPGFR
jgi:integrase